MVQSGKDTLLQENYSDAIEVKKKGNNMSNFLFFFIFILFKKKTQAQSLL